MQGEIQALAKHCEVADDSVVVLKSRPMKAGNSVEDNPEMTFYLGVEGVDSSQNLYRLRRDEVYLKDLDPWLSKRVEHKLSDGTRHINGGIP